MMHIPTFLADACSGQSIFPSIYRNLQDANCEVTIDQLGDIKTLIANGIEIGLMIAGFVAVGFIIYGGFQYIVSGGEPAGIKRAKDTIVNAVVGLILAMVSFGVVRFISDAF